MNERNPINPPLRQPQLHLDAVHESGHLHVTGAAVYVDDIPSPSGMLVGHVVVSPVAHGKILRLDTEVARGLEGVHAVLTADDIPGVNDIAPIFHDEHLLAVDEVHTVGQAVAFVVAQTAAQCRAAAQAVVLEIQELPALLTLEAAIEAESFHRDNHRIERGDVEAGLSSAALRITGEIASGGQDHFYLETQASLAVPTEDGTFVVHSSTQHPSEVQAKVAEVLGLRGHSVVVKTHRMGGAFGGKESQAGHFAALAALGAMHTGRPVKVWLNRDQDMTQTGKRHPFLSRYDAGLDADGKLLALRVDTFADGGWSSDLSTAIRDRCLFHLDNAYFIPAVQFSGRVARTNVLSNTAFRGFGGPQGMLVIEEILTRAAEHMGVDPVELRRLNYYAEGAGDTTPYGQALTDIRLQRITDELLDDSSYASRRAAIEAFNASSRFAKRGIAFQPVKFGISFTNALLNQAGALVLVYADGSVQLNHGGTEMGQGLHSKMVAVCAHELGVAPEAVRVMTTATDKVPNTSATAASCGSDLNGAAVADACRPLRERLRLVAAELAEAEIAQVTFSEGSVLVDGKPTELSFADVTQAAYVRRVCMSQSGFYATPGIAYDAEKGRGTPFHYFAYGAAVVEVEVNGLTGEHRLLRVDILHDAGHSLLPSIDVGQVEGGFIQGYGWLTCEELIIDGAGVLRTHSPDTYKIPSAGQTPADFHVRLLDRAAQAGVIHGSKAVGEPPFPLAIGVVTALRHAVGGFAPGGKAAGFNLGIPCTAEAVLRALIDVQGSAAGTPV